MKNWLSESIEISTFPFGLVACSPDVASKHWKPFPTRPLAHLHFPVGLSHEAPNPHFGILLQVVRTPSHFNEVAGIVEIKTLLSQFYKYGPGSQ